jgi:integrase
MATAFPSPNGEYQVQYTGLDGKRKSIWLGKVDADFADEFRLRIDRLVKAAKSNRPPDAVTQSWLDGLEPKYRKKLHSKGLLVEAPVSTISQLCDYAIARADVGANAMKKYVDCKSNLLTYFGDRGIYQVSAGDAEEFAKWLPKFGRRPKPGPLATATVKGRIDQAKLYFSIAVKKRWLVENPFADVKVRAGNPTDRLRYITQETSQKVMDAADPEFRLIFAFARYLGLRTPSETWPLQWSWVNWEEGFIRVKDSKRQRHPGKEWRFPPIFPEIQEMLWEHFNSDRTDPVFIFKPRTVTDTALRNQLSRVCLRAGVMPWPKLWQNLRSTRETELVDMGVPLHVVCQWIGNTPAVAYRHYLQIFKEHSDRVLGNTRSDLQRWAALAQKTTAKNLSIQHGSDRFMTQSEPGGEPIRPASEPV